MTALQTTDRLFFAETGISKQKTRNLVTHTLAGSDGGELYLERTFNESLGWSEGRLNGNSFYVSEGFGLRCIANDKFAFASSNELSLAAIKQAADTVKFVRSHALGGSIALPRQRVVRPLYDDANPLLGWDKATKIKLLSDVEEYLLAQDPRIRRVNVSLTGETSAVQIIRADGYRVADIRPLIRLNIGVTVEENGRIEEGGSGFGGRADYAALFNEQAVRGAADEALRQALLNLRAAPCPSGEMTVVMGSGWPGVMLHEAVGHGLEGDANRKGTSAYAGLVGQQVASKGVTVIDQGNIAGRRGSLNFDDEGTKTQKNILIEDGVLRGYMQDQMNARLMGVKSTGNGRRENFQHAPIPRMTNTFMAAGAHDPADIIESVKDGIYAVGFSGGQVNTTSGDFVFEMTEAYPIRGGKVDYDTPLKGATLIGNGPKAMKQVSMVGNDLALDPGIGTCGKAGQGVPVGIGQPTVKMEGLRIGGTG